jgi:RNA-binding protein
MHVGKEGVTQAAVHALSEAFNGRELVKIKVLEAAPVSARDAAGAFAKQLEGVHLVHVMGRTIVLYRPADENVKEQ